MCVYLFNCSNGMILFQDNVFVTVVASIQYRVLVDKASDAFYRLSNPTTQIKAYVFDGNYSIFFLSLKQFKFSFSFWFRFLFVSDQSMCSKAELGRCLRAEE